MSKIHIVYATDYNYILLCCVSISSLLKSKAKEDVYEIHILTDGSIQEEGRRMFSLLEKKHDGVSFCFHTLDGGEYKKIDYKGRHYNQMTYYRFFLPDLLEDIDECIYLDCDTLVCSDISEMLSYDISDAYMGVVWDCDIDKVVYPNFGNLDLNKYFNAGVLYLNLRKLREDKMLDCFSAQVGKDWYFNDQDILNYCCKDKVVYMEEKFNQFSYKVLPTETPVVMHFLGEKGMRPWVYKYANGCDQWWKEAELFSDFNEYKVCKREADQKHKNSSYAYLIHQCRIYENVYIFGGGFYGRKLYQKLKRNHVENMRAFLDNKTGNTGKTIEGYSFVTIDEVDQTKDNLYIIAVGSEATRNKILEQLRSLDIQEEAIIPFEERLSEEYYYMDPKYLPQEKEEYFLGEFGSGTERLGWKW
ncbi:MAG: hypothetical protein K5675_11300 [Lachnospiraceae bacterium]|nr:hypothetical protein [Lachnospiraceae bacterium]